VKTKTGELVLEQARRHAAVANARAQPAGFAWSTVAGELPVRAVAWLDSPSTVAADATGAVARLENLDPEARKRRGDAIERARSTMPDQIEAACDQGAWPEAHRRCILAATTMSDVDTCR